MGLLGGSKQTYVYSFDEGKGIGKDVLGGKGANLSEMMLLGFPIPDGFTISTQTCDLYYQNNKSHSSEVLEQIDAKLKKLEKSMGKKLGDPQDPLLLSVRSGAVVSMPGMMDTVLNLGLNDESVEGLIANTGNERFVLDSYRRFIQMFGDVVMEVEHHSFEVQLDKVKIKKGVDNDSELTADDLREVIQLYKDTIQAETGKMFPNHPREQLQMSIDAVFGSWNNARAISYRRMNNIRGLIGTAVNVQAMVFGNMGENSGTGVCFTRNPSTGENKFYGEFLMNAQGEDVVAGIRTPKEIQELNDIMPECYQELVDIYQRLEKHYRDMQDMEFTIQEGKLYILQTRSGKRTAQAAVKISVDMVEEGLIDRKEAIMGVSPEQLDALLHKQINVAAKKDAILLTKALPASPGAAVGKIVFTAEQAKIDKENGKTVILVRKETSPEDIEGMEASQGVLTARGGMTSHAAVVARGMGTCCVAGAGDITIDEVNKIMTVNGKTFKEYDILSLDGNTGEVFEGALDTIDPDLSDDFDTLMQWADEYRTLGVRANADSPKDSILARKFGAEGIGLCRTEHMFFEEARIKAVREMILSEDLEGRKKALKKILPYQKDDFLEIFKVMEGLPCTIRYLDPPLHEFLPQEEKDIKELAKEMGVSVDVLNKKIESLHEFNPMLGHRGCRLAITYPEIAEMQTEAVIDAACELKKQGVDLQLEIMIPLVGEEKELSYLVDIVKSTAMRIIEESGIDLNYKIGTMIEVPRGALTADKVAKHAEFFSFGTNDLTQMGYGYSRDDAGKFIKDYIAKDILEQDPFQALDQEGIGELVKIAVEKGRKTRPDIKLGICGEHGGDPSSIDFFHRVGLAYVSCSPYRVPIARLAAAQAAIRNG